MQKLSSLCILLVLAGFMFGQNDLILDKVIARVGSQYILYSEVQELYNYAKEQNPEYDESLQCVILEQLLAKNILLDQAKLDSIEVSDIEVEVELDRRMNYILQSMGGDEDRFYQIYGKTPLEQREVMREPMKEQMIEQRIQGQIIQGVDITPDEVKEFFAQIPEDSLPYFNAEVEIGEITMKTMISDSIKNAAYNKLENIRTRIIEDGEKFEELASIFSDDPGSGRAGGDLGWAKRGTYVPEFEASAYSLEKGEISEIVETKFGYHILELLDRRGNSIRVRHILIRPEITDKDIERTKSFIDSISNQISIDSLSFDLAVKLYSDKEAQSYNNAGRLINNQTGDTFWETSQLPYQIYFAIDNLEVGQISEVLEFEEQNEKVFKVIRVQSKTKPHRASLTSDYAKITDFAKESKKNEYFNEWMEEKINNTYIVVMGNYATCPNIQKYKFSTIEIGSRR